MEVYYSPSKRRGSGHFICCCIVLNSIPDCKAVSTWLCNFNKSMLFFRFGHRRRSSQSSDVEEGPADDGGKLYVIEVRVQWII